MAKRDDPTHDPPTTALPRALIRDNRFRLVPDDRHRFHPRHQELTHSQNYECLIVDEKVVRSVGQQIDDRAGLAWVRLLEFSSGIGIPPTPAFSELR
jgi:hypothetical protein